MARAVEYVINGPSGSDFEPLQSPHKPLSMRREHKAPPTDLRTLYHHAAFDSASGDSNGFHLVNHMPATPVLPPTPPTVVYEPHIQRHNESSGAATHRSSALTPVHQHSPPTPDNTPPRDRRLLLQPSVLGTQLSLVSTRAESFKTAAEDFISDPGSFRSPDLQHENPATHRPHHQLSRVNTPVPSALNQSDLNPCSESRLNMNTKTEHLVNCKEEHEDDAGKMTGSLPEPPFGQESSSINIPGDREYDGALKVPSPDGQYAEHVVSPSEAHIGVAMRDCSEEAGGLSTSTSAEKLARIIGWTKSIDPGWNDCRRASGMSATSTIGAIVLDSSPPQVRTTKLRKTAKHTSLRSVSSPLPVSMKTSRISSNDSPHRLVHKKARLSNENRLSFGSEPSRSFNTTSSTALPNIEVIMVAVIPERRSSLQSSANSSRRQSVSGASHKTPASKASYQMPPSSWQQKRIASELPDSATELPEPVVMPPNSSSPSVPPASISRANSMASATFRVERQKAEKDLRKTLDRMESDMLVSSFQRVQEHQQPTPNVIEICESQVGGGEPLPSGSVETVSINLSHMSIMGESAARQPQAMGSPGPSELAALRAPSLLRTPFSQPSYQSASPEINQATAVNIFAHNNHSVQLIEASLAQGSRSVQRLRRDQYTTSETQSPLRNPRPPPVPPKFTAVQAGLYPELDRTRGSGESKSAGSTRFQLQTESPEKSLGGGITLKNARNRKASQDLDSSLYPFWRPRPFWEGMDSDVISPADDQDRSIDGAGSVNNSLGFQQRSTIVRGPVSLIRRISQRRHRNRAVEKQTSQSSLARLRASQTLYKNPMLGMNLKLSGIRQVQQRILLAKQKKEDEKREQRRAALRKSIGTSVISQGDSRFPASSSGLTRM